MVSRLVTYLGLTVTHSAAFEEPAAKKARKAAGKKLGETEDDDFGANDADWDMCASRTPELSPRLCSPLLFQLLENGQ